MAYVPKDGTGSFFQNKFKKSEKQPDRVGTAMFRGEELEVSGWLSKTKDGETYLSFTIKSKDARPKTSDQGGEQQRDFRRERDEFF